MQEQIVFKKEEMEPWDIRGWMVFSYIVRPVLEKAGIKKPAFDTIEYFGFDRRRKARYEISDGEIELDYIPEKAKDFYVRFSGFEENSEIYKNMIQRLKSRQKGQYMYDEISASMWWE